MAQDASGPAESKFPPTVTGVQQQAEDTVISECLQGPKREDVIGARDEQNQEDVTTTKANSSLCF